MNGSPMIPGSEQRPIWFEPFLQQVKKQLGYPFDLTKYTQLLQWANANRWSEGEYVFDRLYAVCRVLFLQNHEHEPQFREIFVEYIFNELDYEQNLHKQKQSRSQEHKKATDNEPKTPVEGTPDDTQMDDKSTLQPPVASLSASFSEPPDTLGNQQRAEVKKYLNLRIPSSGEEDTTGKINSPGGSRFLLNDSYLPLTKREMIHGWRHLRKKSLYKEGSRLDICATVQHIATEGLLLQPVFEKEPVNSDNLLLILADRRGSMTPFHKLTDKLIETAISEGGHRNALVYYFYNCPVDFVYKTPSLTEPVALSELYSLIRPDHTNALVISDGGAARGNMNSRRAEQTLEFLYGNANGENGSPGLHKSALFVSWLNPMPRHRWRNTTASVVDRLPDTPMYSVMEKDGYGNFLNIIQKLMGR